MTEVPTRELRAPIVVTRDLCKVYAGGAERTVALDGVDLSVWTGEMVAVLGASGSGKTTLLQLLGCLDRPTSGSVRIGDRAVEQLSEPDLVRFRRGTIGFLFQDPSLVPSLDVIRNVRVARHLARLPDDPGLCERLLAELGLGGRLRSYPHELSRGQCQRVALARALAPEPSLLLCDEPTASLDSETAARVFDLLEGVASGPGERAVIVATHDVDLAERARRVVVLRDGRVRETRPGRA